jgi:protein tyrosine phosphatase
LPIKVTESSKMFQALPRDKQNEWNVGSSEQHLMKNRYRQIIAYDFNRVIIGENEYINASYIKVENKI